jgi:cytidylate kinase
MRIFQKKIIGQHPRICCEGRDQASTILRKNPRYDVAFYFRCNLNTASLRRWRDLKKKIPLKEVKKSLRIRTLLDKKRRHNPLKKMADAVLIRSDILGKKTVIAKMSKEIDKKLLLKYGRNFRER